MTPEQRAAARARCESATKGDWSEHIEGPYKPNNSMYCGPAGALPVAYCHDGNSQANLTFIAHARTDLPAALDALDAAEARIAELQSDFDAAMATVDQGLLTARQLNDRIAELEAENARLRAAVQEEREACAKLLGALAVQAMTMSERHTFRFAADAIRTRGDKT